LICPLYTSMPYQNFFLFLNFIPAIPFPKNTHRYDMFLCNALAK
jgi:hypothetical protein